MKIFKAIIFCSTILIFNSCQNSNVEIEKIPGINIDFMDTETTPNEDFFRYVNGKWYDNTEIPDDRTNWGKFRGTKTKY